MKCESCGKEFEEKDIEKLIGFVEDGLRIDIVFNLCKDCIKEEVMKSIKEELDEF